MMDGKMETVENQNFVLVNDTDVKEFVQICEENNRTKEKDVMEDMCDLLDGLQKELAESRKQIAELTKEVQLLKEDKVTAKIKAFANDTKETALLNIKKMEENLSVAKVNIKDFAKKTVENFKKAGIVAFDTVLTTFPVKSTLNLYKNQYRDLEKTFSDFANKCDAIKTKLSTQLENAKKAFEVLKGNKVDFSESEEVVVKTSKIGNAFRVCERDAGERAKFFERKIEALENVSVKAMSYVPEKWSDLRINRLEYRDKVQSALGIDTKRTGLKNSIDNLKNQKAGKTATNVVNNMARKSKSR